MILGHYGIALAAKRVAPDTSLGTLTFAAQLLDELWPIFILLGIEHVGAAATPMAANNLDFISYPYSHSLLMSVVWGALVAGAYYALRHNWRTAAILGAAVVSHWMLDLPMHRPDLPLWPGSSMKAGFGLWNLVGMTIGLELLVFGGGIWLYERQTVPRDWIGRWGLWTMIGLLLIIFASGFSKAQPPSERTLASTALLLWVFVPWTAWIDRHRTRRHERTG